MRYSDGSFVRAGAAADVAADAYVYFSCLFSRVERDIALIVADEADWPGKWSPYGLPFFRDDPGEIRPGVVVMPAGGAARMRAGGYSTLDELQAHYTGADDPMTPLNYVWFQYRWRRLAAKMFDADGEGGVVRSWQCFQSSDRFASIEPTAASLASLLRSEVSHVLGRAVMAWR